MWTASLATALKKIINHKLYVLLTILFMGGGGRKGPEKTHSGPEGFRFQMLT